MNHDELKFSTGAIVKPMDTGRDVVSTSVPRSALVAPPSYSDLRGFLPPAWDQGSRPLCTAFAMRAAALCAMNQANMFQGQPPLEASVEFHYNEGRALDYIPPDQDGSTPKGVAQSMRLGIVPESSWQFNHPNPGTTPRNEDIRIRYAFANWGDPTPDEIMHCAMLAGSSIGQPAPVVAVYDVGPNWFDAQGGNVINKTGDFPTLHAVGIVGWRPDAWLIRNSWGGGWAMGGHAWVSKKYPIKQALGVIHVPKGFPPTWYERYLPTINWN